MRIEIEGPGGTMGVPVTLLKRLLIDMGYTVEVKDNYNDIEDLTQEEIDMIRDRGCYIYGSNSGHVVINKTSHPWGG